MCCLRFVVVVVVVVAVVVVVVVVVVFVAVLLSLCSPRLVVLAVAVLSVLGCGLVFVVCWRLCVVSLFAACGFCSLVRWVCVCVCV